MESTTITYRGRKLFTVGHFGTFIIQILIFLFGCGWLSIGIAAAVDGWGIGYTIMGLAVGLGIMATAFYAMYENRKEAKVEKEYKREVKKLSPLLSKKRLKYQNLGKGQHVLKQDNVEKEYIVDNYAWEVLNDLLLYSDRFRNSQVELIEIIYDGLGIGREIFEYDNINIIESEEQSNIEDLNINHEIEEKHISKRKLKIYLVIATAILIIAFVFILWINKWAFNLIFAISAITIISTLILLICLKKPSFSIAFLGLFIGAIIYCYALGFLVKDTCPYVTIINKDCSRTERFYLPVNDRLGNNQLYITGGCSYILNNTGKTVYLTKISYGNNKQERNNVSQIKNGDALSRSDIESIRWFSKPREKIFVSKGTEGKIVTYIDFQSY